MVMIHGYGGSAITFYRMFDQLSKHYRIFAYDMLGMGLSSRPEFFIDNPDECIAFFVESMEKWRQKLGLTKFHLVGHSMGGYVSSFYASKYPQYVFKLTLLSPAGINKNSEELDWDKYMKGLGFWQRLYMEYMWNWWQKKKSPQMVFKEIGIFSKVLFKHYMETRMLVLSKDELKVLYNYLVNMVMEPESSEKALHVLYLPPRAAAFRPSEDILSALNIPVDLYFGTRDWVDWSTPQRLCEKTDGRISCVFVPHAGHQLIVENPRDTCNLMYINSEKYLKSKGESFLKNAGMNYFESSSEAYKEAIFVKVDSDLQKRQDLPPQNREFLKKTRSVNLEKDDLIISG